MFGCSEDDGANWTKGLSMLKNQTAFEDDVNMKIIFCIAKCGLHPPAQYLNLGELEHDFFYSIRIEKYRSDSVYPAAFNRHHLTFPEFFVQHFHTCLQSIDIIGNKRFGRMRCNRLSYRFWRCGRNNPWKSRDRFMLLMHLWFFQIAMIRHHMLGNFL